MRGPVFVATDLDGGRHTLQSLLELSHTASLDSPADSLSLTFLAGEKLPECWRLEGYLAGERIYAGGVDTQRHILTGKGCTVTLTSRTPGSLLLDNEALPLTFVNPTLEDICHRYLAPYGVFSVGFSQKAGLAQFIVSKGLCDWEVLVEFCRLSLGREPYLDRDLTLRLLPAPAGGVHRVSNTGPAWSLRYRRPTETRSRHQLISKVCIRDREGYYSSALENPLAQRLKIRRKRYLIPPGQYAQQSDADARQLIARSMGGHLSVEVELLGYQPIRPADWVTVEDPGVQYSGLLVLEVQHSLDSAGYRTTLKLGEADYWNR